MLKLARYKILSVLVGLIATPVFASSSANLSLVGDANLNNSKFENLASGTTIDSKGKWGFGGGALLNLMLAPTFSFEVGGLYITRKSQITSTASGVSSSSVIQGRGIEVPFLLRYWFSPLFSIGGGGYWAHGMGNIVTFDTNGTQTNSESYEAKGTKKDDEGLVGSVAFRLPLSSSVRFLVDGRYTYGLTNVDTTGSYTQKFRDVQVLAGFTFGMGNGR